MKFRTYILDNAGMVVRLNGFIGGWGGGGGRGGRGLPFDWGYFEFSFFGGGSIFSVFFSIS